MVGELKIWALGDGAGVEVVESVTVGLEDRLEETLVRRPEMLEPGLHLVGRQTPTEGGPLDLLGVDEGGRLVVFELKREKLTREAVTQCIDYASALNATAPDQLADLISKHSGSGGVEKIGRFEEWYLERFAENALSDLLPPRLVLVGLGVDARAERVARFLSEGGIGISILTFFGFEHSGETLLARQVEVEREEAVPSRRRPRRSAAERRVMLEDRLDERGLTDLFEEIAGTLRHALPGSSESTPSIGNRLPPAFPGGRRTFCLLSVEEDVGARVQWYESREHYDAGALEVLVQKGERLGWLRVKWGLALDIADDEQWQHVREGLTRFVTAARESWNPSPESGTGTFQERVRSYVREVPTGKVVTYGQVAQEAGSPGAAQSAGNIMRALPDETDIPWHRVVDAAGRLAANEVQEQRRRLGDEGVSVGEDGSVDLEAHGWRG